MSTAGPRGVWPPPGIVRVPADSRVYILPCAFPAGRGPIRESGSGPSSLYTASLSAGGSSDRRWRARRGNCGVFRIRSHRLWPLPSARASGIVPGSWNGPEKRDQERRDNEPGNGKEVQLSRRRFTKEFKLAAVRRLEAGESGSALARELEVKREKLYDWLAQVERYGVEGAFPGAGRRPGGSARVEPGREARSVSRSWNAKSAARPWRLIFCPQPCGVSRICAGRASSVEPARR